MNSYFITGVTGQLGSILTEKILQSGDKVYGLVRRTSTPNDSRIKHLLNNHNLEIIQGDITDASSISHAVSSTHPDFYLHAAAQSHVAVSFSEPLNSFYNTALGCVNGLEAIRLFSPKTKYVQFSTSELYGANYDTEIIDGKEHRYQDELTAKIPNSPYAVAKLAAHEMTRLYRQSYGLFASCAICFNMESYLRTETFVTRKITRYIGKLVSNCGYLTVKNSGCDKPYSFEQEKLTAYPKLKLGNIFAARDWQSAHLAADAILLIVKHDNPDDFVVASGECHTVKDFLELAFNYVGLNWQDFVETDSSLLRPSEVPYLCGKTQKIEKVLGWNPRANSFQDLVLSMVKSDIKLGFSEFTNEKYS